MHIVYILITWREKTYIMKLIRLEIKNNTQMNIFLKLKFVQSDRKKNKQIFNNIQQSETKKVSEMIFV